MPSEKSRYLMRNRGPESPIEFKELRERLVSLGTDCLADMIWQRFQLDKVLKRSAVVSITLRSSMDLDKAKAAIDYAFHFPDPIHYSDRGYGQILWEVKSALEHHVELGHNEFAFSIGQYAVEKGKEALEAFLDDWDWQGPLIDLNEWFKTLKDKNV
jgi:hypothetical protein